MRPLLPPMRRYGTDRPARLPYVNLLVISALLLYFLWRVCMPNDMPRRRAVLQVDDCPYATGGMRDLTSDGEILPTKLMGVYQLTSKLAY